MTTNVRNLDNEDKKVYLGLPTKSSKIRYLNSKDWTRGQIAKYMEIRYQHVRNVLITPVKNPKV